MEPEFLLQNVEQLIFIIIHHDRFHYLYNRKDQGAGEFKKKVFGDFLVF